MSESMDPTRKSASSLSLSVITYFNWHFVCFFWFVNICLFTYKSIQFYYPARLLGWDFVTIFLYIIVESTRLLLSTLPTPTLPIYAYVSL